MRIWSSISVAVLSGSRRLILGSFLAFLALSEAVAAPCGDISRALNEPTSSVDTASAQAFYESFGGGCAWEENAATTLIETLRAAGDHGLDPALFHADSLSLDGSGAERDVLLTDGALKYAAVMTRGLSGIPPSRADRAHTRSKTEFADGLIDALIQGEVAAWLEQLPPRTEAYLRLKTALSTYRGVAEAGGFERVPETIAGKWRRKTKDYSKLRRRLAQEGDLAADSGSARYDDDLWNAVVKFQERNSLRADGRLTAKTIERLNVSAGQRVAQIALNLDRMRVAERDTPATRVEVNVPAATAVLYRDGAPHLRMNAVVGAPGHDTPTLTSTIDTVILNPTWTVPQSIIENEIKPALKRNKKYLEQNRMYWSRDQLVQEPGAHNALGRIKFDFPNRYSVYLHDTPARRLFTDPERAQSHGCVRLERPLDLAVELLKADPEWSRGAIEEAINQGATRRVALSEPIPVVITYQTAFVADDGAIHFRPDIYGLDTKLTLVLSERAAAMRSEPPQW